MGNYVLSTELANFAGGVKRLTEIADWDDDVEIDTGLLDSAIDSAEALIDSFVKVVRAVPVSPTPEILKTTAAKMAIFELRERRCMLDEREVEMQLARLEWLEQLSKGKVRLGTTVTPPASDTNRARYTDRPTTKSVGRENLKGFH